MRTQTGWFSSANSLSGSRKTEFRIQNSERKEYEGDEEHKECKGAGNTTRHSLRVWGTEALRRGDRARTRMRSHRRGIGIGRNQHADERYQHLVPTLIAPADGLGGIGIQRIVGRVVPMRDHVHLGSLGDL